MTITQKLRARKIIARIAKQHGISADQCHSEMLEAIRTAWNTTDPQVKDRQIRLVGEGRIPTPEELISVIAKEIT